MITKHFIGLTFKHEPPTNLYSSRSDTPKGSLKQVVFLGTGK